MWKARAPADVAARAHADGLDDLRAGAARDLAAERRALVAVQLDHREPEDVGELDDALEALVDEHADELHRAPHGARDPPRLVERARAAASRARGSSRAPRRPPRRQSSASSRDVIPQCLIRTEAIALA